MAKKSKKSPQPETSQQSRDRAASSSQATPVPAKVDTLISTQGLVKAYKGRRVVNQVSIHIRPGEIVGLLGPNGAGKTTTFNMVVGIVRPDEGSVKFGNEVITDWPIHKRARLGIGYLTQEPSVFRGLTVRQNILAILETLKISKAERMERLDELMNELDLTRLADSMAYALSGGEKRRLEVTRALVTNPSLLLLDEPFSGIDPVTVDEVQRIVRDLKARGLGVLITDHKARETLKLVDRAYLIHQGEMLKEGDSDTLAKDPEARRVYLGQDFDWQ
jgi:lipopolysaccharide export system ATP-binding protein